MADAETHCYCGNIDGTQLEKTFQCYGCKRRFHQECLKNPVVSPLVGDTFYQFTCSQCAPDGTEQFSRAKMQWQEALMLTLYNLQLGGGGKRGYFHWKDHIVAFIDRHWSLLFGNHKKKKPSWHGTVAGVVSSGCPRHFVSGTAELGESGWWKLTTMKPPLYLVDPLAKTKKRTRRSPLDLLQMTATDDPGDPDSKRSRRSKNFSLLAASELKARRSTIADHPRKKRRTMAAMAEAALAQASTASQQTGDEGDVDGSDDSTGTAHTAPVSTESPGPPFNTDPSSDVPESFQLIPVQAVKHPGTDDPAAPQTFKLVQVQVVPQLPVSQIQSDRSDASGVRRVSRSSSSVDGTVAWENEEPSSSGIKQEASAWEGSQVSSADSFLMHPDDSDNDCPDLYDDSMSSVTMGMAFEPCRSPDMVDLIMSMPGAGEGETPGQPGSLPEDSAQPLKSLCRSSEQTSQSPDVGKHPPHSSAVEDSTIDSEGPSEGEEEMGGRSEEEETEEEEEGRAKEERDGERDASVTVLSAPTRTQRRMKRRSKKGEGAEEPGQVEDPSSNLRLMTRYDEKAMLEKLNSVMSVQPTSRDGELLEPWEAERLCHQRNRLRRKLMVRKLQRENGLPVFDIEAVTARIREKYCGVKPQNQEEYKTEGMGSNHPHSFSSRTLDRFMRKGGGACVEVQHKSFYTRLVGFEDHQLQPIVSPYTMRVLKPFIWRDTETVPLKVKLLQEIISHPHRNDPTWTAPPPASLDYCYVRPQHMPSVNALCSAYFWPGIDLSECLQYPDFSCVVMYRKLVVGFAFLVPDVKHNEAYISFIFTRPEWRGAGIASFMLYHLCQTCMGKDITLHVSATNPAMLMYQKFGFKAEELCLDFYDKYFPVDSKECKHAFFMRLR